LDRVTAVHKAGGFIYQQLEQQAALLSFADAYFLLATLFLVAIPVFFLLRGAERSPRQRKGTQRRGRVSPAGNKTPVQLRQAGQISNHCGRVLADGANLLHQFVRLAAPVPSAESRENEWGGL